MKNNIQVFPLFALAIAITSCGAPNQDADKKMAESASTATSDSTGKKAISLFDGKSLAGWHGYGKTGEVKNWVVEEGAMVCLGASKDAHGGDIVTDSAYENFELSWEWKVDKGSNSGVMYHVVEDAKHQAPYETGPEYQIIDDIGFPDKLEEWQKAGADYAMTVPNDKKKLSPVGSWNSSKIIYNKGHVEHWLNGEKILEFEVSSEAWKKQRATSKWKDYPDYAMATKGLIALQDHGNRAYFKNIHIIVL